MKTENFEIEALKDELTVSSPLIKKQTSSIVADFKKVDVSLVRMIERLKTKRDVLFEKKWL